MMGSTISPLSKDPATVNPYLDPTLFPHPSSTPTLNNPLLTDTQIPSFDPTMPPSLHSHQINHFVMPDSSHACSREPSLSLPISSHPSSLRSLAHASKMTANAVPFSSRAKDEIGNGDTLHLRHRCSLPGPMSNSLAAMGCGNGNGGGLATSFQSLSGFPASPLSSLSSSSSLPSTADESASGKYLFGSAQPSCHPYYLGPSMSAAMGALPKKISLYKTEFCRTFEETGFCRYGVKCQFAHDKNELRIVPRHPRYKTEICRTFWELGNCPYGKRCCFIHLEAGALLNGAPPGQGSNLSEAGLPFPLSRPLHNTRGTSPQGASSNQVKPDTMPSSENHSFDQSLFLRRDLPFFTEEFPSLQPPKDGRHTRASSQSLADMKNDTTAKENQAQNMTHSSIHTHFLNSRSNSLCHESSYSIVPKPPLTAHHDMDHLTTGMDSFSLDPSPDWTPMTSFYEHLCRSDPTEDMFLQERLPSLQTPIMPRHIKRSCSISLPTSTSGPTLLTESLAPGSHHGSDKMAPISRPLAHGLDAHATDAQWLWSFKNTLTEPKQIMPYASTIL